MPPANKGKSKATTSNGKPDIPFRTDAYFQILSTYGPPSFIWEKVRAHLREHVRNGCHINERGFDECLSLILRSITTSLFPHLIVTRNEAFLERAGNCVGSGRIEILPAFLGGGVRVATVEVKTNLDVSDLEKALGQSLSEVLSVQATNSSEIASPRFVFHALVSRSFIKVYKIDNDRKMKEIWRYDGQVFPKNHDCHRINDEETDFIWYKQIAGAQLAFVLEASHQAFEAAGYRSRLREGSDSSSSSSASLPPETLQQLQVPFQASLAQLHHSLAEEEKRNQQSERNLRNALRKELARKEENERKRADPGSYSPIRKSSPIDPSLLVSPSKPSSSSATADTPSRSSQNAPSSSTSPSRPKRAKAKRGRSSEESWRLAKEGLEELRRELEAMLVGGADSDESDKRGEDSPMEEVLKLGSTEEYDATFKRLLEKARSAIPQNAYPPGDQPAIPAYPPSDKPSKKRRKGRGKEA